LCETQTYTMKNLLRSPRVPIVLLVLTVFAFCNKKSSKESPVHQMSIMKSFPEINLSIDLVFESQQINKAEVKTSSNFSIESINSTYNDEQKREYISLKCKRKDDNKGSYFVYIVREFNNNIIASYSLSNN
jgi:hypothetical protein